MSNQDAKSKSLIAFAKIFKSTGIEGVWLHLLNIWFDITRNIDTVERYKTIEIKKTYVTTAQSSIRRSLAHAINFIDKQNKHINYNFIELGAGKGKVLIVLKEIILKKFHKNFNILAIELDKNLCKIFRKNLMISGFSEDQNKALIITRSFNLDLKVKVQLLNEDIQNSSSKDKIKEIIKLGHTIYYCCDSQTKESLLNLVQEIIKNKVIKSNQLTLFIYANPRYLDALLKKFRNELNLIIIERGIPQKAFAILNIL